MFKPKSYFIIIMSLVCCCLNCCICLSQEDMVKNKANQKKLQYLGFYKAGIDGFFKNNSKNALSEFYKRYCGKIKKTGKVLGNSYIGCDQCRSQYDYENITNKLLYKTIEKIKYRFIELNYLSYDHNSQVDGTWGFGDHVLSDTLNNAANQFYQKAKIEPKKRDQNIILPCDIVSILNRKYYIALQNKLAFLDYYKTEKDGFWGKNTQKALDDFYNDYTENNPYHNKKCEGEERYDCIAQSHLYNVFKDIKNDLKELEYFKGEINGSWDQGLIEAISSFQKNKNIPITKKLDKATQQKIQECKGRRQKVKFVYEYKDKQEYDLIKNNFKYIFTNKLIFPADFKWESDVTGKVESTVFLAQNFPQSNSRTTLSSIILKPPFSHFLDSQWMKERQTIYLNTGLNFKVLYRQNDNSQNDNQSKKVVKLLYPLGHINNGGSSHNIRPIRINDPNTFSLFLQYYLLHIKNKHRDRDIIILSDGNTTNPSKFYMDLDNISIDNEIVYIPLRLYYDTKKPSTIKTVPTTSRPKANAKIKQEEKPTPTTKKYTIIWGNKLNQEILKDNFRTKQLFNKDKNTIELNKNIDKAIQQLKNNLNGKYREIVKIEKKSDNTEIIIQSKTIELFLSKNGTKQAINQSIDFGNKIVLTNSEIMTYDIYQYLFCDENSKTIITNKLKAQFLKLKYPDFVKKTDTLEIIITPYQLEISLSIPDDYLNPEKLKTDFNNCINYFKNDFTNSLNQTLEPNPTQNTTYKLTGPIFSKTINLKTLNQKQQQWYNTDSNFDYITNQNPPSCEPFEITQNESNDCITFSFSPKYNFYELFILFYEKTYGEKLPHKSYFNGDLNNPFQDRSLTLKAQEKEDKEYIIPQKKHIRIDKGITTSDQTKVESYIKTMLDFKSTSYIFFNLDIKDRKITVQYNQMRLNNRYLFIYYPLEYHTNYRTLIPEKKFTAKTFTLDMNLSQLVRKFKEETRYNNIYIRLSTEKLIDINKNGGDLNTCLFGSINTYDHVDYAWNDTLLNQEFEKEFKTSTSFFDIIYFGQYNDTQRIKDTFAHLLAADTKNIKIFLINFPKSKNPNNLEKIKIQNIKLEEIQSGQNNIFNFDIINTFFKKNNHKDNI